MPQVLYRSSPCRTLKRTRLWPGPGTVCTRSCHGSASRWTTRNTAMTSDWTPIAAKGVRSIKCSIRTETHLLQRQCLQTPKDLVLQPQRSTAEHSTFLAEKLAPVIGYIRLSAQQIAQKSQHDMLGLGPFHGITTQQADKYLRLGDDGSPGNEENQDFECLEDNQWILALQRPTE